MATGIPRISMLMRNYKQIQKNEGINQITNQEFSHTVTCVKECEIFTQ